VSRLFSFWLVALLSFSASGVAELVLPEPCSPTESSSVPDDGTCAPTCARCHCARAFDFVFVVRVGELTCSTPDWHPALSALPLPIPHDILHVPKAVLS
jgi:hypothetical protein